MSKKLFKDKMGNIFKMEEKDVDLSLYSAINSSDKDFQKVMNDVVKLNLDSLSNDIITEKYPLYKQINIQNDFIMLLSTATVPTKKKMKEILSAAKLSIESHQSRKKSFEHIKKELKKRFIPEAFEYYFMLEFIKTIRDCNNTNLIKAKNQIESFDQFNPKSATEEFLEALTKS